jgi:hypothetical protein
MSWVEQCQIVGDAGYKGVEIAAFTLVKEGVQEISPDLSTQETEKIIPRNEGDSFGHIQKNRKDT